MGKLVGSVCILTGCLVLLICWMESTKQSQCVMQEMVRFFRSWEYVLQTKQTRVIEFLEMYPFRQAELQSVADDVRKELCLHTYPTGQIVWQKILKKHTNAIRVPQEAYQILLRAGESLFGTNSTENLHCIQLCIQQMQQCIEEERKSFREKRKVYMPVGMLTGVMIVILLL